MVLAFEDNHMAAVPVPPGKAIDIVGPAEDDRFMVISVDGQRFHVFEADLRM